MEILNSRAALLSNFEVLSLLRESEKEQLVETRAALAVKKEQSENGQVDFTGASHQPPVAEVCENLRTVQFEIIAHLSAPFQPYSRQTPQGIRKITKGLASYELTKGEKLQIVNLAPAQPVELYVIVEELEDRLRDKMEEVLLLVKDSLLEVKHVNGVNSEDGPDAEGEWDVADDKVEIVQEIAQPDDMEVMPNEHWEGDEEFVDNEGGFEGDLDLDDIEE